MKRKTIKKLGIIIMSAMIAASPVVTPFTTMTVYAVEESVFTEVGGTITSDKSYDKNVASGVYNSGTIGTNEGSVASNYGGATIVTNEGSVDTNYEGATIVTNEGSVRSNYSTGTIVTNKGSVTDSNAGTIVTNEGSVRANYNTGTIETNKGRVTDSNYGTIENNYGTVESNSGKIVNNFNTIDGNGGKINSSSGTIENQWYEVKLENNTTELKIKGSSIKDIDDSGNIDVFVPQNVSITIYSTISNKIIDSVEDSLGGICSFVKNADGSITISGISNPYSLLTTLIDKILPPASSSESEKKEDDNKKKDEVVIEVSFAEPVVQALTQPQIVVPAGAVNAVTVVAENPVAATQAAKTLQNDPVVVAQAEELTVHMEAVTAAYKEVAVKELAASPKQAVVGSAEYEAKQAAIVADLANQMASLNNLTVQSLAVVQKIGVSVATGGCTKLEAANVSLLNEILAKGVPVTLTYAINGTPVTIKIPAGVNLTRFIGADGKLDLTKLRAYIVR